MKEMIISILATALFVVSVAYWKQKVYAEEELHKAWLIVSQLTDETLVLQEYCEVEDELEVYDATAFQ